MRFTATAERARVLTLALHAMLMAVVVLWLFTTASSGVGRSLAVLATLPLWLPLRGLLRGARRTYAWATLCVIPYFVIGLTEAIANPRERAWAGACLMLALALFTGLIAYLRLTKASVDGRR